MCHVAADAENPKFQLLYLVWTEASVKIAKYKLIGELHQKEKH